MVKSKLSKSEYQIKTNDQELKAIYAIQKALSSLDPQAAGRVLTFCIDRARQDFERGLKAEVGQAAKARILKEAIPEALEPLNTSAPVPEPDALQPTA